MKAHPPPAQVYAPEQQHGYGYPQQGHPPSYPQHHYQQPAPTPQNISFAPVTNQPVNQATNIVVNAGGGGGGGNNGSRGGRQWSTKTFGCCEDMSSCMCALFCTPCFLAQLSSKSGECYCLPFCVPEALMAMRVKLRAEEGIKGSIWKDCVCAACCPLLVMCQLHREMNNIAIRKL